MRALLFAAGMMLCLSVIALPVEFDELDTNGDGQLTYNEFAKLHAEGDEFIQTAGEDESWQEDDEDDSSYDDDEDSEYDEDSDSDYDYDEDDEDEDSDDDSDDFIETWEGLSPVTTNNDVNACGNCHGEPFAVVIPYKKTVGQDSQWEFKWGCAETIDDLGPAGAWGVAACVDSQTKPVDPTVASWGKKKETDCNQVDKKTTWHEIPEQVCWERHCEYVVSLSHCQAPTKTFLAAKQKVDPSKSWTESA